MVLTRRVRLWQEHRYGKSTESGGIHVCTDNQPLRPTTAIFTQLALSHVWRFGRFPIKPVPCPPDQTIPTCGAPNLRDDMGALGTVCRCSAKTTGIGSFPRGALAVLLNCLLDGWSCLYQILRGHHVLGFDGRAQTEEQGFGQGRNLRRIVHIDDKVATTCAIYVAKIR